MLNFKCTLYIQITYINSHKYSYVIINISKSMQEQPNHQQAHNQHNHRMEEQNNQSKKSNINNQLNNVNDIKIEHPPMNYSVTEMYMIRKQSIAYSNDLIVKRLQKCFNRIKKMKQSGREQQLYKEYDQESSSVRRSFRRVHDLFKQGSKVQDITRRKIHEMKTRVEKVKNLQTRDQINIAKDVDMSKAYMRTGHITQAGSSQKNLQK